MKLKRLKYNFGVSSSVSLTPEETLSKNLHYKSNFNIQCIFAQEYMVVY